MSIAIKFAGVSVRFVLHHQRARSFQDALIGLVHRKADASEEFWALKDASFEVVHGNTLGIVGQNGSGKSTILKLMTRILEPTSGSTLVLGKVAALIELGAGFHPDLTGRENIYLNGSILGFSRRDMDQRFDEIVAFSELERFIDTPVKHYSSGMYARLGFSVAVSVEPDVLIIDEVLAVGDEAFQRKCFDRIFEFKRQGRTIVFVSHGLGTIEQLCDQVLWLHGGRIQEFGAAPQVIREYTRELQLHEDEMRNLASVHASSTTEQAALAERQVVGGAGEFTKMSLRSEDGQARHTFRSGETMIARLDCRTDPRESDREVRIELRRIDGLLVFSTAKRLRLRPDGLKVNDTFVELIFGHLPLLAGSYDLSVAMTSGNGTLASRVHNELKLGFTVWNDDIERGIVDLRCRLAGEPDEPDDRLEPSRSERQPFLAPQRG